jgi:hypothetical protein
MSLKWRMMVLCIAAALLVWVATNTFVYTRALDEVDTLYDLHLAREPMGSEPMRANGVWSFLLPLESNDRRLTKELAWRPKFATGRGVLRPVRTRHCLDTAGGFAHRRAPRGATSDSQPAPNLHFFCQLGVFVNRVMVISGVRRSFGGVAYPVD